MVVVKDTGGDCLFLTDSTSLYVLNLTVIFEGGQELHSNGLLHDVPYDRPSK